MWTLDIEMTTVSWDRAEATIGSGVRTVIWSQATKSKWGVTMWIEQDTKSRKF